MGCLLAPIAQECPIQSVPDRGARRHERIEQRLARRDKPTVLCLLQDAQATDVGEAVWSCRSSRFTFLNEEGPVALLCKRKRVAFAAMKVLRELRHERAGRDAGARAPWSMAHFLPSRFARAVDYDVCIDCIRHEQRRHDSAQSIAPVCSRAGQKGARVCNDHHPRSRPLGVREGLAELPGELFCGESTHGNLILRHQLKDIIPADPEDFRRLSLREVVFSEQRHDQRFLCFQSDLLSAALYQQLVRQLKLQLESAGHEVSSFCGV
jgi:hypothetical protein